MRGYSQSYTVSRSTLSCVYCSSSYYLPVTTACISFETYKKMYFALMTFRMLSLVLLNESTKSTMCNFGIFWFYFCFIKQKLVISLNISMQIMLLLQDSHRWCFAFFNFNFLYLFWCLLSFKPLLKPQ